MRGKNLIAIVLLSVMVVLGACGATTQASGIVSPSGGVAANLAGQIVPPVYSSYNPGLTVVGTGTIEAKPDIVYLTLGVDIKADNAASVVSDASTRMDRILHLHDGADATKARDLKGGSDGEHDEERCERNEYEYHEQRELLPGEQDGAEEVDPEDYPHEQAGEASEDERGPVRLLRRLVVQLHY